MPMPAKSNSQIGLHYERGHGHGQFSLRPCDLSLVGPHSGKSSRQMKVFAAIAPTKTSLQLVGYVTLGFSVA